METNVSIDNEDTEDTRFGKLKQMMKDCTSHFPDIEVISTTDLQRMIKQHDKVWVVDVRDVDERAVSVIPGSISTTELDVAVDAGDVSQSDLIIPYCTVGYRSGMYAQGLKDRGFFNVRNSEGILLWTYSELPLVVKEHSGERKVREVHTFGQQWDLASPQYKSIYHSSWQMYFNGIISWIRVKLETLNF